MPRQTPSASDYTSVVRSSAVANDVASKPAGSPGAAKAAAAAVRGGGGLGSLGAIGSIVKQSVVAKSIAPPVVQTGSSAPPLLPLQLSGGTSDAFVVAYTSSGAALWTAKISSIGTDTGNSVTVDTNGNIYVSGMGGNNEATSTISAYNANGTPFATTLTNVLYGEGFIVKYNTTGAVQWIARIGTSDIDSAHKVTTDSNGNVYVVGKYGSGTATAYNADKTPFSTTLPNTGSYSDAFIIKYNSNGFVQWFARIATPSGRDFFVPESGGVVTDSDGNVYIAGQKGSSIMTAFNANGSSFATTLPNNNDSDDTFIVKYNSSGNVQWITRMAGNVSDVPYGLATDSSGNVYVGGVYDNATLTLYNSDGTPFSRTFPNNYHANGYIAKYNSSGFVQWGVYIGNADHTADTVYGICTDSSGNVYVTGTYNQSGLIRNSDGTEYLTMQNSGTGNAYVAKYDPNGNAQWVGRLNYCSSVWGIYADSSGGIYMVGESSGNGPMSAYSANGTATGALFGKTLTNRGNTDAFIVKFNTSGAVQWLTSVAGTASDITRSVTVDKDGKLYIAGSFASSQLTAYSAA
jgi:hypothetical protein